MREIVLDTETTGLEPQGGDRIVEIGCIELVNHIPTGEHFHVYINPERDMPQGAFKVHGLSAEFLAQHPVFEGISEAFMAFVGAAKLVIHNASFDMSFINMELERLGIAPIPNYRAVDTLEIARRKHPGQHNNLDALCARYGIDNAHRDLHGALLDAELLAEVYIELIGGKQADLGLGADRDRLGESRLVAPPRPEPLPPRLTVAEEEAHRAFIATLGSAPLWWDVDPATRTPKD